MSGYLGLDTSNYTTSAALSDAATGEITQQKQLLPVREGEHGLRQSDAVFHHVRQLPCVIENLNRDAVSDILAVAASDRPQQKDGSYMPCFLVGAGTARELGALLRVPVHFFTHQQGHVAAALYGAQQLSLLEKPFLAFHFSGGTTDALLVRPDKEAIISCEVVAHSLDLKAGQLIDRVGGMLGLPFPAGPALERLADTYDGAPFRIKATMKDADCHLSGAQNQCQDMLQKGFPPAAVAAFCMQTVCAVVVAMTESLLSRLGDLPLIYAGGVMSNKMLQETVTQRFGGVVAPPVFSADNAAGIATLCRIKEGRG